MGVTGCHGDKPRFAISRVRCTTLHDDGAKCHYQVAWDINPHMVPGGVNPARAAFQHAQLRHELMSAGAELLILPFVHGAFDSVFAKDNALLGHRRGKRLALLGRPSFPQRMQEQCVRRESLEREGFHVVESPVALEGGDVVVLPRKRGVLLGHGFRSSSRAASLLEAFFDAPVLPLELRDPHFYHLDTALSALDDGTVLLCEEAFTRRTLATLKQSTEVGAVYRVPRQEALHFGVNLVQVGRTVFMGKEAPGVSAVLRHCGLTPRVVALDEFHLAGGSAACLVSRLHTLDTVATSATAAMRSTERYAG